MRALIFLLIIIALFFALRFIINRIDQFRREEAEEERLAAEKKRAETMVACDYCGVHLPESSAVKEETREGTHYYCDQEHLKLAHAPEKNK
jgi:uncharacterized protein